MTVHYVTFSLEQLEQTIDSYLEVADRDERDSITIAVTTLSLARTVCTRYRELEDQLAAAVGGHPPLARNDSGPDGDPGPSSNPLRDSPAFSTSTRRLSAETREVPCDCPSPCGYVHREIAGPTIVERAGIHAYRPAEGDVLTFRADRALPVDEYLTVRRYLADAYSPATVVMLDETLEPIAVEPDPVPATPAGEPTLGELADEVARKLSTAATLGAGAAEFARHLVAVGKHVGISLDDLDRTDGLTTGYLDLAYAGGLSDDDLEAVAGIDLAKFGKHAAHPSTRSPAHAAAGLWHAQYDSNTAALSAFITDFRERAVDGGIVGRTVGAEQLGYVLEGTGVTYAELAGAVFDHAAPLDVDGLANLGIDLGLEAQRLAGNITGRPELILTAAAGGTLGSRADVLLRQIDRTDGVTLEAVAARILELQQEQIDRAYNARGGAR